MTGADNGKRYVQWENAGGPNQCVHGYAEGIPCPHCEGNCACHGTTETESAAGNSKCPRGCERTYPHQVIDGKCVDFPPSDGIARIAGSGAGSTVDDEWELGTDMLTGAIRLSCVRGERRGLIYEWRNAAHMAVMHETSCQDDTDQLRADPEAAPAEIERLTEALSMATGEPGPWLRRLVNDLAQARAERDVLRRRTHEIQEAADKRWSNDTQDWRRWQAAIKYADELIAKDPGIAFHSAVTRAALASVILERDQGRTRISELEQALRRILEWDCLNPEPRADLLADLPWLKQHVLQAVDAATVPAPAQPAQHAATDSDAAPDVVAPDVPEPRRSA